MGASSPAVPAGGAARGLAIGLTVVGVLAAALVPIDGREPFVPRATTIDALGGLLIGAFLVDRLLTFLPPLGARAAQEERGADLRVLRWGFGALIAAGFVVLTDLRAAGALVETTTLNPGVDRGLAVLALAGGTVGLKRLLDAINPPSPTTAMAADVHTADMELAAARSTGAVQTRGPMTWVPGDRRTDVAGLVTRRPTETVPPPRREARATSWALLALSLVLAQQLTRDERGTELLATSAQADGGVGLVVRFGIVVLAACLIEAALERGVAGSLLKRDRKVLIGGLSLVLGVAAAWVLDLYLLHNVGFFGTGRELADGLAGSSAFERGADTWLTGVVIAAGTAPIHDLAKALKKRRAAKATEGEGDPTSGEGAAGTARGGDRSARAAGGHREDTAGSATPGRALIGGRSAGPPA